MKCLEWHMRIDAFCPECSQSVSSQSRESSTSPRVSWSTCRFHFQLQDATTETMMKRCEKIWHDIQNVSDIHWIPLVIHWYQWHEVVITLAASCSWRAVPITKAYWSSHPPQCQDPGHEDTSSTYLDHLASGSNILEPAPTSSQKLRKRFCNKEQIHRRTHKLKLGITPACHKLRDFAWLCDSYCCRQAQVVQVTQRDLTPFRRPQIQY